MSSMDMSTLKEEMFGNLCKSNITIKDIITDIDINQTIDIFNDFKNMDVEEGDVNDLFFECDDIESYISNLINKIQSIDAKNIILSDLKYVICRDFIQLCHDSEYALFNIDDLFSNKKIYRFEDLCSVSIDLDSLEIWTKEEIFARFLNYFKDIDDSHDNEAAKNFMNLISSFHAGLNFVQVLNDD